MDVFSVFDFYRLDILIAGLYLNLQRNIETSDSAEEDEHIWLKENTLYIVYCILYIVWGPALCKMYDKGALPTPKGDNKEIHLQH